MVDIMKHEDYVPGQKETESKPWHDAKADSLWLVTHKMDDPSQVLPVMCSVAINADGERFFYDMMGSEYDAIDSFCIRDAKPVRLVDENDDSVDVNSFDFAIFLQG